MNIQFAGDGKNTNRNSAPGDCSLICFEGGLGSTGHSQGVGAGGSLFVCLCVCTGLLCSSGIDGHGDVCLTPCSGLCTIEISEPTIRTQGGSQYREDTHMFLHCQRVHHFHRRRLGGSGDAMPIQRVWRKQQQ